MPSFEGLPEGPLRIALVSHEYTGDYPRQIDVRQVRIELEGWDRREIERYAVRLGDYNRNHAVVVTPQREPERWVGFRNVEAAQLETMRRDGFEPAWVVKAGERFDVLLKAPSPLTPEESRQLKYHLTARYELTLPQGVFRDAVRLPGFEAERAKPASRVELVEVSERSFSAGERVLTQLRNREEHVHIARWARSQPLAKEQVSQPVRVLATQAEARPTLPATHPVALLQRRLVEEAARLPAPQPAEKQPLSALAQRASEANREMLTALARNRSLEAVPQALVREVARLELELGARSRDRIEAAAGRESDVAVHRRDIAAADRAIFRAPSPEEFFEARSAALMDGFQAEVLRRRDLATESPLPLGQARLATERLQAALLMSPRDERVHEAFRLGVEREVKVILYHDTSRGVSGREMLPLPELKAALAARAAEEEKLFATLRQGNVRGLEDWASQVNEWRDRVLERRKLERAVRFVEAGAKVQAATIGKDAALFTERDAALSTLTLHLRALHEWNTAAPLSSIRAGAPKSEMEALQAVARGDVSPRALSRLQGELIASTGERAIPPPLKPLTETDPLELLRRFASLESEVRKWASEMSAKPAWFDGGAEHLVAKSAALIQVQQAVEKLERRQYGVAEPSPAPDGISQATWDRAWLKRAEEKHLPQPERHLGNVGPPLAPRELAMERAAALKMAEVKVVERLVPELSRGAVLK